MSSENRCDRCGKTFEKKQGLTQHMKRKTPCDNKKEIPMRIVSE